MWKLPAITGQLRMIWNYETVYPTWVLYCHHIWNLVSTKVYNLSSANIIKHKMIFICAISIDHYSFAHLSSQMGVGFGQVLWHRCESNTRRCRCVFRRTQECNQTQRSRIKRCVHRRGATYRIPNRWVPIGGFWNDACTVYCHVSI